MSFYGVKAESLCGIAEDLCAFVRRVSTDKDAKPAELEILPDIAKIIFEIQPSN